MDPQPWEELEAEAQATVAQPSPPLPPTEEAADGGPPPCWEQLPEPASEIHPRNLAVTFSHLPSSPAAPPQSAWRRGPAGSALKRRLQCVSNSVRLLTASGERVAQPMQVMLRIRPSEVVAAPRWRGQLCIHATAKDAIAIAAPEGSQGYKNGDRGQSYTFSQVFGPDTDQDEYFQATTAPMVVELAHSQTPFASVIMAYGITASGKTHTIQGVASNPGVLPRALDLLFKAKDGSTAVDVSHYEVYNEQVYDLLGQGAGGRAQVKVKENATGHIFIAGLSKERVSTTEEALGVLHRGSRHRQRAGTALNQQSSRSHTIFTISLTRAGDQHRAAVPEGADPGEEGRLGQLSFVDLAGAERANRTGNAGKRLKESVSINSSLMTLGRCMEALRWNQRHPEAEPKLVPYRESKVTHIFRDVLHGWGRLVLSVCVSPAAADYDETHRVLKYAQLATQISQLSRAEAPNRPQARNQAPGCAGQGTAAKRRRVGNGPMTARKGCPPTAVRGGVRQSLAGGPPPEAPVIRQMAETIQSMEEVVLDLRAENKSLREQVEQLEEGAEQAAQSLEQEVALTEARVREEVSEDMKELLAKMEARYKERELEMRDELEAQRQELAAASAQPGASAGGEAAAPAAAAAVSPGLVEQLRSRCYSLEEELQAKVDELLQKEDGWAKERAVVETELTTAALAAEEYWKAKLTQQEANTAAEIAMLSEEAARQAEVARTNRALRGRVQELVRKLGNYESCSCGCSTAAAAACTPRRREPAVTVGGDTPHRGGGVGTPHTVALQRALRAVAVEDASKASAAVVAAVATAATATPARHRRQLSVAPRPDADARAGDEYASLMASTELLSRMQSTSVAMAEAPPSAMKGLRHVGSPTSSEEEEVAEETGEQTSPEIVGEHAIDTAEEGADCAMSEEVRPAPNDTSTKVEGEKQQQPSLEIAKEPATKDVEQVLDGAAMSEEIGAVADIASTEEENGGKTSPKGAGETAAYDDVEADECIRSEQVGAVGGRAQNGRGAADLGDCAGMLEELGAAADGSSKGGEAADKDEEAAEKCASEFEEVRSAADEASTAEQENDDGQEVATEMEEAHAKMADYCDEDDVLIASPHHESPEIGDDGLRELKASDECETADPSVQDQAAGNDVPAKSAAEEALGAEAESLGADDTAAAKGAAEEQCNGGMGERHEERQVAAARTKEHKQQKKRQSSRRGSRLLAELAWSLPVDEEQYYTSSAAATSSAADSSLMAAAKMVASSSAGCRQSVSSRRRSTRLAAAAVVAPPPPPTLDSVEEADGEKGAEEPQPPREQIKPRRNRRKSTANPRASAKIAKGAVILAPITEAEEIETKDIEECEPANVERVDSTKVEAVEEAETAEVGAEPTSHTVPEAAVALAVEEEKENLGKGKENSGSRKAAGKRRTRRLGPANALLALNSDVLDNSPVQERRHTRQRR
eukprot:jgi/Tetstr1/447563/TSEL_034942.t1